MIEGNSSKGAAAIEFTFAGVFFILAVIGIIEMSRVLAARTLLIKGAQDAAILAAQYPDMDIDIPESGITPGTPDYNSPQYFRYAQARQKVIDEAISVPTSTILSSMGQCPPPTDYL